MDYQERYEQLLEEKKKIELEFGLARRRFKELYVGCENQLNNEKETARQLDIQVTELSRQVDNLKSENEGIRIAAKISEEAKQEEYGNLQGKHQEEIASLQHIWKEASYDSQNKLVMGHEDERKKLLEANSKLEQKIRQMDDTVASRGNSDGLVSMMSNAFTSKKAPNVKVVETPASLENSQQQVQQDIDAWKSVVLPLEMEIESLKNKLMQANSQITGQNVKEHPHMKESSKTSEKEFMLNEELKEAQKYFESEKSARTDLEMYVAVLNTQKGVLQEDSDKLKRELHNVCRLFEQEKMNHNELKQTWKLANEHFLAQQQNLISELEITKQLLTPTQVEQLSKNNFSDKPNAIKTVAEHPYQVTTLKPAEQTSKSVKSSDNLIDFGGNFNVPASLPSGTPKANVNQKSDKITDSIFNTFFPAAYQARQFNEMLMDDPNVKQPLILSSSSDSEDDDLEQAIRIQNMNRYGVEEATEMHEVSPASKDCLSARTNPVAILEDFDNETPMKKSISTDDILHPVVSMPTPFQEQQKSLSQGDISWSQSAEVKNDSIVDAHSNNESLCQPGMDSIWNNVSVEYAHSCMMCQNYEKQLQRLQKDYMAIKEKEQHLLDNVKSLNFQLDTENEKVTTLEKSIENVSSDNRTQLAIYEKNQQEVDKQVLLLHNHFQEFQINILQEMKLLNGEVNADV